MKTRLRSLASLSLIVSFAFFWGACAGEAPEPGPSGLGVAGVSAAGVNATAGTAPAVSTAGATGTGGAVSASGAAQTLAGAPSAGSNGVTAGNGGSDTGSTGAGGSSGSGGLSNTAGNGGTASGAGGSPVMIPAGCMVSNPVSFKADIGPWLNSSCGKGKGKGCHVTDDASTVSSGGFNHAYDWITAGSHNEFCKQTPDPIRYTVVMDVIRGANPPSCTSTRVMPPDGPPVTECQKAALAAWLAEPKVLQMHRTDDTSPATAYLMPPFN
jgi:hypothetical protein